MIGISFQVHELAVANRADGATSARAVAAYVRELFGVHKLPVEIGLNGKSLRMRREFERHARGERRTGGFEETSA